MGNRPTKKHSIDRKDNDKGYSPDNCRWATSFEQACNTSCNKPLLFRGRSKLLVEWDLELNFKETLGLVTHSVDMRIRDGWSVEDAFTLPKLEVEIYEVFGEHLTTSEIREKYGVPRTTLEYRLKKGIKDEELVTLACDLLVYDVGGPEPLSEAEIASIHGVNRRTLRRRVAKGLSGSALVTSTNSPSSYIVGGVPTTINAFAKSKRLGFAKAKKLLIEAQEKGVCVLTLALPEYKEKASKHKLYFFEGEGRTITEWSKLLGLNPGTVIYRLEAGLDLYGASRHAPIEFAGKTLKAFEWAEQLGLTKTWFSELRCRGLTMQEILDNHGKK